SASPRRRVPEEQIRANCDMGKANSCSLNIHYILHTRDPTPTPNSTPHSLTQLQHQIITRPLCRDRHIPSLTAHALAEAHLNQRLQLLILPPPTRQELLPPRPVHHPLPTLR